MTTTATVTRMSMKKATKQQLSKLCTCSTLFVTFLRRPGTTATWNSVKRRFMEGVNKLFFIPLNLCSVAKNSSPGKFTNIWHLRENNRGHPRCNIIYLFSLFYKPLSGLGSLSRMFWFLCFTSAVSNKLYYTWDELNNRDKVWNKAKSF